MKTLSVAKHWMNEGFHETYCYTDRKVLPSDGCLKRKNVVLEAWTESRSTTVITNQVAKSLSLWMQLHIAGMQEGSEIGEDISEEKYLNTYLHVFNVLYTYVNHSTFHLPYF